MKKMYYKWPLYQPGTEFGRYAVPGRFVVARLEFKDRMVYLFSPVPQQSLEEALETARTIKQKWAEHNLTYNVIAYIINVKKKE